MTFMMKLAVDNGAAPTVADRRRAILAQVNIGRKALGMEEEDYRAVMERVTGNRSAKVCTDRQLRDLIAEFERLGWRSRGGGPRRAIGGGSTVRKAQAIWISLYQLGAVDDARDSALEAFGRRQLGVDRLAWTDAREAFRLIEALKAIAARNGWSHRLPARLTAKERTRILRDRLIAAQLARLAAAGVAVPGPLSADRADWTDKQLLSAAAELAAHVRALPKPP